MATPFPAVAVTTSTLGGVGLAPIVGIRVIRDVRVVRNPTLGAYLEAAGRKGRSPAFAGLRHACEPVVCLRG
jgi:hypothetical protein